MKQWKALFEMLEGMKNQTRTAFTSSGRQESVAEHSWRLALMGLFMAAEHPELDSTRVVGMCLVHDLGELLEGDIPATDTAGTGKKEAAERASMTVLSGVAPAEAGALLMSLWEEYQAAVTPEAAFVKGLDKLETLLQHNQGINPDVFDYAFNLEYGRKWTDRHPALGKLREAVDQDTRKRMREGPGE